jgi:6-phosphogluconate dehydrogenase
MQLGMIGLGKMGGNMVRRLMRAGHEVRVYSATARTREAFARETGAQAAASIAELTAGFRPPRVIWLMVPAAGVDQVLNDISGHLHQGDILVDGGNSFYLDDIRRSEGLSSRGIHYIDCGTSGGVWGLERGYCLMIGGPEEAVQFLDPIFKALSPGRGSLIRTPGQEGKEGTAEEGYLHCGPTGAGHFVKMIHNGIEYGLMAAYAEGLNLLARAGLMKEGQAVNVETTPLGRPGRIHYDFDLAAITELWRRGSVIGSWLLDLCARAFSENPDLSGFSGTVDDSGEGRWAVTAAVEAGVPVPVLSAALFQRFSSRGEDDFARKVLSALRFAFGGHVEAPVK